MSSSKLLLPEVFLFGFGFLFLFYYPSAILCFLTFIVLFFLAFCCQWCLFQCGHSGIFAVLHFDLLLWVCNETFFKPGSYHTKNAQFLNLGEKKSHQEIHVWLQEAWYVIYLTKGIKAFCNGCKPLFMLLYSIFIMFNKSLHTVHVFLVQVLKQKE